MNTLVKPLTFILGAVLTIVGIAGFFVSGGNLLWFQINTLHNVIHIVSGVIGLWASSSGHGASRTFLIVFGLIYGVVTVLGFAMSGNILGLIMVNDADNYLHLAITAVSLVVGFGSSK